MTDTGTGNICLHDNGGVLDLYPLTGVLSGCPREASFVECGGRAVPGTARCVEPWMEQDGPIASEIAETQSQIDNQLPHGGIVRDVSK